MLKLTKKMGGKMKGFWSINTSPLNNPFCQKMATTEAICSKCYSQRLEKFYGAVKCIGNGTGKVVSWVNNGVILSERLFKDYEIPLYTHRPLMRFSAHGELFNKTHLKNFIAIAEANPQTYHALWTKRVDLTVNCLKKLDNLQYVYSVAKMNKEGVKVPKGFDKVFTVFNKEYIKATGVEINCQKNCMACLICYVPNSITHVNEQIK